MGGKLQMNNYPITALKSPTSDGEAANNKYVDENIIKANIKPSHTPKNVFQYLMDDVNEWTTEYGVKVGSISVLNESPHSWDKKVLNITPMKNGNNYRFRVGLQMFRMKTNEKYSLVIELYNRDYITWEKQETYVNGTGMWVESHNTTKYQYHYGSSDTLYYTKTLIKFKKTSSSPPVFVYFTVHFDGKGGDMNTYPKEFKNQIYMVAYGVEGLIDHVDSEVYDAHEAFEIDKTEMNMLVPLDMNGKKILNTEYDLKFGSLFKLIKCYLRPIPKINGGDLYKLSDRRIFSFSVPIVIHMISIRHLPTFNNNVNILFDGKDAFGDTNLIYYDPSWQNNKINFQQHLPLMLIFYKGLNYIRFLGTGSATFNVEILISYM